MISLRDFDGIAGYLWGTQLPQGGELEYSKSVPESASRTGMPLVARVLAQAPFEMPKADLQFSDCRVLVRRGNFGLLLLFCERTVNAALVDVVILEGQTVAGNVKASSDSSFSAIQSINDSLAPIPEDVIQTLIELWTEVLGPLAPVFARRDASAAGIDLQHVATRDWSKLLNLLARRIDDDVKRDHFLDEAVLLKTRF